MKSRAGAAFMVALLTVMPHVPARALEAELGGSMASMRRQHQVARLNDYTFLRTPAQLREFVREDRLQHLASSQYLLVNRVSYPYARPSVKLFVERLAKQYYEANGERLVVTSLTRPLSRQPRNAHHLSVHPAGMAVDLRIPKNLKARLWLESALLQLEARGVLDATLERRPPHYHIAVFPEKYTTYAARLIEREASQSAGIEVAEAPAATQEASLEPSAASEAMGSAHGEVDEEPVVEAAGFGATVPLMATLGVAGIAIAGLVRRRVRGYREERRSRVRS